MRPDDRPLALPRLEARQQGSILAGHDLSVVDISAEHFSAERVEEDGHDQPAKGIVWDAAGPVGHKGSVVPVGFGDGEAERCGC